MLSKYFIAKTNTKKFDDDMRWSMGEIYGKRVIIFGADEDFLELNKKYKFNKNLNVVAIADKRFETENYVDFYGMRAIKPADIEKEDYDVILISNEDPRPALDYVFDELDVDDKDVRTMFNEDVKDERENYLYLDSFKFEKTLPKLIKKLKNKKVVFYGAGIFLELVKKYYDLSDLDVIAIADKKFEFHGDNEEFLGYKVISPDEILNVKPDYVVVTTKMYMKVVEDLYCNMLKGTKIKLKPLVKKPFMTLFHEIWK